MTVSFSADDFQQLLQSWWQTPVDSPRSADSLSGNETAQADSAPPSEPDSASNIPPHLRLQQMETMMGILDSQAVASVVLDWYSDLQASERDRLAEQRAEGLLAAWGRAEKQRWNHGRQDELVWDDAGENWCDRLAAVYQKTNAASPCRAALLAVLAWQGTAALQVLTDCLVQDPPVTEQSISLVFGPLLHRDDLPVDRLFPRILDAVSDLPVATAVMDLGNFLYRERQVRPHPASERANALASLLGNVVQRLIQIEEDPVGCGMTADRLSQVINDSVGLVAALCDTLALIGDTSVVGKIYPCLEVKHRRVQLEGATALAALGEEEGRKRLIDMAAQPVVRRRVLAYCKELGLLDHVDRQYQSESALAESELALWLSHPSNMGFAPFDVSLVDQRQQFWPGFAEPVNCFLLRYSYPFEERVYQNIGLVGPITHSFSTSLTELPPDDVYAVFAGWHTEHPEIYVLDFQKTGPLQRGTIARLEQRLQQESLDVQEPHLMGHCLDEWSLIVRAAREGRTGWAIADQDHCLWLPDDGGFGEFDAQMAWYLYLGRRLLKQFNT